MKKSFLLIAAVFFFTIVTNAQSFIDDFESYEVGDYLALNSEAWSTWNNLEGTDEDVMITDERASSGSKSIKFFAADKWGGPQDILFFFTGEKISTGILNVKMKMYVENSAHFNFQAELEPGDTFGMNARFYSNSLGRILSMGNQTEFLSFEYPQNEWIGIEININFDVNEWQFLLNDTIIGTFANEQNSIASIDFYPSSQNSFFIDDFSFEYDPISSVYSTTLNESTSIYPNPTSNSLTIDFDLQESTDVIIEILDLTGKSCFVKRYENKSALFKENIDTSAFPIGSYLMHVKTNEHHFTKKFSVMR